MRKFLRGADSSLPGQASARTAQALSIPAHGLRCGVATRFSSSLGTSWLSLWGQLSVLAALLSNQRFSSDPVNLPPNTGSRTRGGIPSCEQDLTSKSNKCGASHLPHAPLLVSLMSFWSCGRTGTFLCAPVAPPFFVTLSPK